MKGGPREGRTGTHVSRFTFRVAPDRNTPPWQLSLSAILLGQLVSVMGYSFVVPFLPLFIQELGIRDVAGVAFWSGAALGSAALASAFAQPFWGALGDRTGFRTAAIRAHILGAIATGLTGLAPNVGVLLVLRAISGAVGGSMGPNVALASSIAPPNRLSFSLGLVQTAIFVGASIGPVFGGLVADTFGMRGSFLATASCLLLAALVTFTLVKVEGKTVQRGPRIGLVESVRSALGIPALLTVAGIALLIQFSNAAVQPTIALVVQQFEPPGAVASTVGAIFGLSAVASAISAIVIGRLSDSLGQRKVLAIALIGAGLTFVPQALATSSGAIIASRVAMGLFIGGALPGLNTLAIRVGGNERRAVAISIVQSASSLGLAFGPYLGAALAATLGLVAPFWATGILLIVAAALVAVVLRRY